MDRRGFVRGVAGVAAAAGTVAIAGARRGDEETAPQAASEASAAGAGREAGAGRLKQSVCRWCYGGIPLDDLCRESAAMGLRSVELLSEEEWEVPARHGLTCAVANGPTQIQRGMNRLEHHDEFVRASETLLPKIADAGLPAMIVFSGNRNGLSDADGLRHCVTGLKRIAPIAERCGVTVVMELLNSKVDHIDYQCDRTPWGAEVMRQVGSPRVKLLYDIYHMQIMEGDVIRTIRDHGEHIGHYHTGGVPGRREIDEAQELYYPAICRAIAATGYDGYLGQEFIPSRDPMTSLRESVRICTV